MEEEVKVQEQAQPETEAKQPETKQEDLISRASQVKLDEKQETQQPNTDDVKFDYGKLDNIKSPEEAKQWAEEAYKSLQRGFNTKFQEVASLRKSLEAKAQESQEWTPERVQSLLNDPKFVESAQAVAGQNNQNDYMTEEEKARDLRVKQLENEIRSLQQQNSNTLKSQQDNQLQGKYANYKPEAVDILTADLLQGKVQATREHLWKVIDYDAAVRRAYELGKQDRKLDINEKESSMSFDGSTTVNPVEKPQPREGENDRDFFRRVALENLAKAKQGQTRS